MATDALAGPRHRADVAVIETLYNGRRAGRHRADVAAEVLPSEARHRADVPTLVGHASDSTRSWLDDIVARVAAVPRRVTAALEPAPAAATGLVRRPRGATNLNQFAIALPQGD
jgi:hypothetical protein